MRQATRDRQQRVLTQLLDLKHVTVNDLAGSLGISEATARRDLRSLAGAQRVTLVHGGATVNAGNSVPRTDFSFQAKHDRNLAAKQTIGRLAAGLVADGQQLFLDSGTTSFAMAPHLASKRGLSIVLNSARLALELRGLTVNAGSDLNIIMLGGQFRPDRLDTVGAIALANLERLRVFTTFIGADGLSMDVGPQAIDIDSAHLNRLAIQNGRQTILLVDHTKFEEAALYGIVGWEKINHVVTDEEPSDKWAAFLSARNIGIHFPI